MGNLNKIAAFILSVVLLTACNAESGQSEELAKLEAENQRLTEELAELKSKMPAHEQENEIKDEDKENVNENEISLNEPKTIEEWAEFTLNRVDVGKSYHASKNESFAFEVEQPENIFIEALVSVKNLQTTAQSSTDMLAVKVIYNNKYEYEALPMSESSDGQMLDILTVIDPLMNGVIHYVVEVPEKITKDDKSIVIEVSANNETFFYRFK